MVDKIIFMKDIISVKNLCKTFGDKRAVDKISFDIQENTIFGILGPNGSGKTTTLRMLTTILSPTSGSIKIDCLNYYKDSQKIRYNIGYVPQADALYKNLSVWDNVDFFFSAYHYVGNHRERINEVLRDVGLYEVRKNLAKNLSGGMLKRLSIACAIAHKPKIVFFDEVTMGLDPVARQTVWDLLNNLKKSSTVVMTTHYMDEAEELCDELVIMSQGKIIDAGKPKEVIKKYEAENLHDVFVTISKLEKNV